MFRGIGSGIGHRIALFRGRMTTVVVDKGHLLELETLDARLEGMREGTTMGEDTAVEQGYEPHSFLSRPTPIAPGETAHGTVTFQMSTAAVEDLAKEGNLDIDNFGPGNGAYDPEEVFTQPELGVMRTYGPRQVRLGVTCRGGRRPRSSAGGGVGRAACRSGRGCSGTS